MALVLVNEITLPVNECEHAPGPRSESLADQRAFVQGLLDVVACVIEEQESVFLRRRE